MIRLQRSVIFGSLAALSLLFCLSVAWGEELAPAPQPADSCAAMQKGTLSGGSLSCLEPSCCGETCHNRTWIVDIAAVWLAPIQCQNFGAVGIGTVDSPTHPTRIVDVLEGFETTNNSDFTLSPRITFGVQGECWGVLARYWRLQTGCFESDFVPITCEGAQGASCFNAETFDLEATQLLCPSCDGRMLRASCGFRYAQLHQAADLAFSETGTGSLYQSSVFAAHDFSGPGVTLGLQGVRPVGCGHFNLFFDARGSFMFDDSARNYVVTHADFISTVSAHSATDALSVGKSDLFIGEVQVGGQWNLPLKCIPANAFVRCAFEYQYWCNYNGGSAAALSAAGPSGGLVYAYGEADGNTHVNLVGFNIATGLTW